MILAMVQPSALLEKAANGMSDVVRFIITKVRAMAVPGSDNRAESTTKQEPVLVNAAGRSKAGKRAKGRQAMPVKSILNVLGVLKQYIVNVRIVLSRQLGLFNRSRGRRGRQPRTTKVKVTASGDEGASESDDATVRRISSANGREIVTIGKVISI